MRSPRLAGACALGLLVALAALALSRRPGVASVSPARARERVPQRVPTAEELAAAPSPDPPRRDMLAPQVEPSAPASGIATLLVTDPSGAPIGGALCLREGSPAARRRALVPPVTAGDGLLGTTGPDGRAVVPVRAGDPAGVVLVARGFLPGSLPGPLVPGGEHEVVLSPGATKRFTCVDPAGEPVAGCRVALSRRALPSGGLEPAAVPGADAGALHVGVSDAQGRVVLEGLGDGIHGLRVELDGFHTLRAIAPMEALEVPGPDATLTLASLVGGVFELDPEPLAWGYLVSGGSGFLLHGSADTARARRTLEARFPGAKVLVSLFPGSLEELRATLRAVTEDGARHELPIPLVPLCEVLRPSRLRLAGAERRATGRVSLAVVDDTGAPVPLTGLSVVLGDESRDGFLVDLVPGEARALPRGTHALRCPRPWIERALHPASVTVPGEPTLLLAGRFRPCLLEVSDGEHRLPDFEAWVEAVGLGRTFHFVTEDPPRLWLPCGPVHVRASAWGFDSRELDVDVPYDPAFEPLRFEIAL